MSTPDVTRMPAADDVEGDGMTGHSSEQRLSVSSEDASSGKGGKGMDSKICGVCGDKALGNNFNAITCESCKAFFRRNALRPKEFVCPFSNNCKVDAITRRFCQRCRLKKCFDIGMKKEWIMTDEEKKLKKQKIEQNRLKRTSLENTGSGGSLSGGEEQDQDSVSSPPAAKVLVTEQHLQQRLLMAVNSAAEREFGGQQDEMMNTGVVASDAERIHKQPMTPHTSNTTPPSPPTPFQTHFSCVRRNGSGVDPDPVVVPSKSRMKPERGNVIAITVNNSQQANPAATPSDSSGEEDGGGGSGQSYHPASPYFPQHLQHHRHHNHLSHHNREQRNGWREESEEDSSSQPPPLVKTSSKRRIPRNSLGRNEESIVGGGLTGSSTSSSSQMPLLASLIRPGHSESPTTEDLTSATSPGADCDDDGAALRLIQCPPNQEATAVPAVYTLPHRSPMPPTTTPQHIEHSPPPPSAFSFPPEDHHYYSGTNEGRRSNHHLYSSPPHSNGYHPEDDPYQSPNQMQSSPSSCVACTLCHHHSHHHPDRGHEGSKNESGAAPTLPLNTMDSILSVAIAAEFNSFGVLGASGNSRELNKAEQAKLNELLLASQALHAPVDAERPIKVSETSDPSLINVINLTEIAIRRLIKMSKKISGFKNMCQEDQIALLKGGCTEMMIWRSAVTYDPDRDSWQIPHSNQGYNINLGVLKEARGNLYEEHHRFVKSFQSMWRKNENIMIILCAITLFTPERPNVVHKDVVKLEQDSYYYLLKRYLESIMNGCEAKSTYLQLIRKVAELRALNSNHVRVFLEVNPKEVEPLLIEIFDLK